MFHQSPPLIQKSFTNPHSVLDGTERERSQAEGNQNVGFISDKCSLEILALDQAMMVW